MHLGLLVFQLLLGQVELVLKLLDPVLESLFSLAVLFLHLLKLLLVRFLSVLKDLLVLADSVKLLLLRIVVGLVGFFHLLEDVLEPVLQFSVFHLVVAAAGLQLLAFPL